jgi:hypothetical protein
VNDDLVAILGAHGPALHALLLRLTLRQDVAEDLLQELFVKLAGSHGFRAARDRAAYVKRAAINLALDWRRARRRGTPAPFSDVAASDQPAIDALIDREDVERILDASAELTELSRQALVMRYVPTGIVRSDRRRAGKNAAPGARAVSRGRRGTAGAVGRKGGAFMSEPDDDIIAPLAGLTRVTPAAQATSRALERARAALSQELEARRVRWRRKIIMSSGIAAVLVVGAAIVASLFNPPRADAAALLQEVAGANDAYRGWVHMRSEEPGEKPGDAPRIGYSHVNTIDGAWVLDHQTTGFRRVQMYVPKAKEEYTFDLATNEVRIGDLAESFATAWTEQMRNFPLTVMAAQTERKKRGLPPAKIVEQRDGELQRFEVTMEDAPPTTQPAATTRPQIEKAIIWTDPKTKLMTKGTFTTDGNTFTMTCTYGDPQIASIYDVGVPRDAKVIDNRVKQDVGALLDRLQKRAEAGFDDGVAVMTEMTAGPDGKIVTTEGALHVFLRSGKKMYDGRYLVGPAEGPNAAFHVPLPANWPTPSADDALAAVRNGTPTNFIASDGTHAWQGFGMSPTQMQVTALDPNSKAEGFQFTVARFGMTSNLWPTRNRLGLFGSNGKAEVVTDPNRPGLIGLKVVQMIWTGEGDPQDRKEQRRAEQTHWLDPKRDDLVVESSWTTTSRVEMTSRWSRRRRTSKRSNCRTGNGSRHAGGRSRRARRWRSIRCRRTRCSSSRATRCRQTGSAIRWSG